MRTNQILTSCLAAAALAAAVPASAQMGPPQGRPERPYRGLFGGGVGTVEQQLVANLSLGGGYDDDLSAEAGAPQPGNPISNPSRRGGPFGSTSLGLSYGLGIERITLSTNYGMNGRLYQDLPSNFLAAHSVGAGVSFKATEALGVSANASLGYQPFYSLALLPPVFDPALGAHDLANPEISYLREKYFSRGYGGSVSYQLTSRTSVGGHYSYQSNGVLNEQGYQTQVYGASLSHGIGKGLSARVGYAANEALYADDASRRRMRFHSIDAGIDFSKNLSLTRRTALSFNTGTTAAASVGGQTRYTLVGNVRLTRELGRTWNAGVSAARDMQFDPILRDITLTDGISVGIGGMLTRRVQLQAGAGATRGNVGIGVPNSGLVSSSASASLQYGVTRNIGVGIQYTYYYTTYESGVVLPPGWPRYVDRQSFVANVNLWAPLMQRTRRPNASR